MNQPKIWVENEVFHKQEQERNKLAKIPKNKGAWTINIDKYPKMYFIECGIKTIVHHTEVADYSISVEKAFSKASWDLLLGGENKRVIPLPEWERVAI